MGRNFALRTADFRSPRAKVMRARNEERRAWATFHRCPPMRVDSLLRAPLPGPESGTIFFLAKPGNRLAGAERGGRILTDQAAKNTRPHDGIEITE